VMPLYKFLDRAKTCGPTCWY